MSGDGSRRAICEVAPRAEAPPAPAAPRLALRVVALIGGREHVVATFEAGGAAVVEAAHRDVVVGALHAMVAGQSPQAVAGPGAANDAHAPAVRAASRGQRAAETSEGAGPLGEREAEILTLVAKGFTFPEIGRLLGISVNTIKTHMKRVYHKLDVHSRAEAVHEALRLGVVEM